MANRLAAESSPYLLQHKDNPVDWYPWGEEAFDEAKKRGVPILVSIGYSTCHWCHVMARESFSDPVMAQLMNANFVNIKVDREERPDIDALYIQSVQALGYPTGWPLNVFLTPDGHPFFGGTYWPRQARDGMPSFTQVLVNISDLWQQDRAKVIRGGQEVVKHVIKTSDLSGTGSEVTSKNMLRVMRSMYEAFDKQHGGFGEAPKFPQPTSLEFLLRHYSRTADVAALSMVELTLGAMAEGGIHDQIGGGFARYSVDAEWHVPHFEKMLNDNVLLLPLFADTYRYTGEPYFLEVAEQIFAWLEREMRLSSGAYAAALNADSEGVEGKFYIWTAAEIDESFDPEDADLIKLHYGISDPGSFENATVLRIVKDEEELADDLDVPVDEIQNRLAALKSRMLELRNKRVKPSRDDKAIASWNGLAIHGLAYAGLTLQKPEWIEAANRIASMMMKSMIADDGAMVRTFTNGKTGPEAVLEDYANTIRGLITLYGATANEALLNTAWQLVGYVQEHFSHESGVGYYDTSDTASDIFTRPRDLTDAATPSGNAVMAENLLILSVLRRDDSLRDGARKIIESMAEILARHPLHLGTINSAAERMVASTRELIFTGENTTDLRDASAFRVDPLVVRGYVTSNDVDTDEWKFLEDKPFTEEPTAYWCRNYTCSAPTTDPEELLASMRK